MISIDNLMKDYRLKSTIRYNNRNKITNESVAEHSFYVALYTLEICNNYNIKNDIVKIALEKALLHDMPERDISDIPYDVKNNIPELKKILKNKEKELEKELETRFKCECQEDNEIEIIIEKIVKMADNYSVYQYCLKEQELGNSSNEFKKIEDRVRCDIFTDYDYLNEYLLQHKEMKKC